MAMRQLLVVLGSVAFLCLWVVAWGILATGSVRQGRRYLRLWLTVMGGTAAVSAVLLAILWPFMP